MENIGREFASEGCRGFEMLFEGCLANLIVLFLFYNYTLTSYPFTNCGGNRQQV